MKKEKRAENKHGMTLRCAVISHLGCIRENNEDNFYFDGDYMKANEVNAGTRFQALVTRDYHLMAICDGMGGLEGGERASGLAVDMIKDLDRPMEPQEQTAIIDAYARRASAAIETDGKRKDAKAKEGTTLAMVYITGTMAHIANVGDSRVYILRNGTLSQLSTDQTRVFQMMLAGELTREQARKHPSGNVINAYLGMAADRISKDFVMHRNCTLCNGDRLFICSDGISDLVSHEKMEEILTNNAIPMDAATLMIREALEMGGKDNSTVIVADVTSPLLPMMTPAAVEALSRVNDTTETITVQR